MFMTIIIIIIISMFNKLIQQPFWISKTVKIKIQIIIIKCVVFGTRSLRFVVGTPVIPTMICHGLTQSLQEYSGIIPRLGYGCFLPHLFQFIIRQLSYYSSLYNLCTNSNVKNQQPVFIIVLIEQPKVKLVIIIQIVLITSKYNIQLR
jgi:hypothetical protein